MGFVKKLLDGFAPRNEKRYYTFHVKCKRCGEIIEGRVDVDNDPSVEYEGGRDVYYARKVVMGSGRCYQQIEVGLKFNAARKVLERRVEGGEFVDGV